MKILQQEAVNAAQTGLINRTNSSTTSVQGTESAAAAESPAATVSFSPRAQEIAKATAAVNEAPDVRTDLVQSLKAKIDSGTYNVSGAQIADMMMRRHAADQTSG